MVAVVFKVGVFGGVIAYIIQMITFVRSRNCFPAMARPYVSFLGNAIATVAGVIAMFTLDFFSQSRIQAGEVNGCAAWYAAGLLYFELIGSKRLVSSPEEEFAVRQSSPTNEGRRSLGCYTCI